MFTFQCSLYDFINIQTRPFCCNNSQAPAHLEFNVNTKTVILVDVKSAGYGVRTDSKFELQLNEPFWEKVKQPGKSFHRGGHLSMDVKNLRK